MGSKKLVKDKSRKAAIYKGAKCLNCGHPLNLTDKFCSNCSQLNSTKQLSLKDFFDEFFSSIFTYDSRLRYTLKDLLFRPGTITRNYVDGQRLKYANPFRFFLSVSIIYFIIQGFSTNLGVNNDLNSIKFNGESINTTTNLDSILNQIPKTEEEALKLDSLKNGLDSIVRVNNINTSPKKEKKDTKTKYLSEAEEKLGEKEAFYVALERALHNYLKGKLDVETVDISKDNITKILESKNTREDSIKRFIDVLKSSDFARYTPVTNTEMKQELERAKKILVELDKQL